LDISLLFLYWIISEKIYFCTLPTVLK
jgi:hypothetical protein